MTLARECETAMDAEWYNSQSDLNLSRSDTVMLLSCHEYDKTRKIMLITGLPEEYLSWLGLRSLEINQRSAKEYIEQHVLETR